MFATTHPSNEPVTPATRLLQALREIEPLSADAPQLQRMTADAIAEVGQDNGRRTEALLRRLIVLGHGQQARSVAEAAMLVWPSDGAIAFRASVACWSGKDNAASLLLARRAVDLLHATAEPHPLGVEASVFLTQLLLEDDAASALAVAGKALARWPGSAWLLHVRARVHERLGSLDAALADLKQAVAATPSDEKLSERFAALAHKAGRFELLHEEVRRMRQIWGATPQRLRLLLLAVDGAGRAADDDPAVLDFARAALPAGSDVPVQAPIALPDAIGAVLEAQLRSAGDTTVRFRKQLAEAYLQNLMRTQRREAAAEFAARTVLSGWAELEPRILAGLLLEVGDGLAADQLLKAVSTQTPRIMLQGALIARGARHRRVVSDGEREIVARGEPMPDVVRRRFETTQHPDHAAGLVGPTEDVHCLRLADARLAIFAGGFTVMNAQTDEVGVAYPDMLEANEAFIRALPNREADSVFFVSAPSHWVPENYAHWMLDYVPMFIWARRIAPEMQLAVNFPFNRPFQKESLRLFGIAPETIVRLQSGLWRVKHLAALTNSGRHFRHALHGGNGAYAAPVWEKARAVAAGKRDRRIFLARTQSLGRTATGIDLPEIMGRYGFTTLDPGTLAVEQQAEIFGRATHVAGVHGAAFANLVFCAEGTKVLELHAPYYGTLAFALTAHTGSLEYAHMYGTSDETPDPDHWRRGRQNFALDELEVRAALENLLSTA